MTLGVLFSILGVSALIVFIAVAIDLVPDYLRAKRALKAEQASYEAMRLARENEFTMALKVVSESKETKHTGKHRLTA